MYSVHSIVLTASVPVPPFIHLNYFTNTFVTLLYFGLAMRVSSWLDSASLLQIISIF